MHTGGKTPGEDTEKAASTSQGEKLLEKPVLPMPDLRCPASRIMRK